MKKRFNGKVVSNKSEKTVSVLAEKRKNHPIYRKKVVSSRKFLAHDETGSREGDIVVIEEVRPISKNKKWKVVENISKKRPKK